MADTYSQIYIHFIFAVKNRESYLSGAVKEKLLKYLNHAINNNKRKLICANGYIDHIHLLISIDPNEAISSLIRNIKVYSCEYLKKKKICNGFSWQEGYAAFSYSKSQLFKIKKYIDNQEEHHRIKTFKEEYEGFLKRYEVLYNEKYLFDYLDK